MSIGISLVYRTIFFNSLAPEKFFMFLLSTDFFQSPLFRKKNQEYHQECQTIWIQIRDDILSCLIWIQTVCKGYQQMTCRQRINKNFHIFCCLLIFFKINFFEKKNQEYHQECRTVRIQMRADILLGLIWVQTVCKGYQQMTCRQKGNKTNYHMTSHR